MGLWGGGLEALRRTGGGYRRVAHFENVPADPFSLPNNDVNTVFEDQSGNLWVGTAAGLAMYDARQKRFRVHRREKMDFTSLAPGDIWGILEDHSGSIWIYGRGGLSQMIGNKGRFRNYLTGPSDAHPREGNVVSCVREDHASNLWVATFGKGLNRLEKDGTFTRFMHPGDSTGNEENFIYSFTEDRRGTFWLSTLVGLVSFDPLSGEFRHVPIDQLHRAHIFGIAVELDDELWLSTGIGLVRFNPRTHAFARYDEKDGMPFTEFFSGFYRNNRGRLYAGASGGFTEFSPAGISTVSRTPEIAITNFSIFDREVPAGEYSSGGMRLSYDQNFCSFTFAALDYANPTRNAFTYRMIGVDKDWVRSGTRNYASYPNLDPGRYVFQVKGSNSDNVWNEAGTSISIVITPPFWGTWWFRSLIVVFIAGVSYGAYRYRLHRLLEVERLRLRIADDLHDDVGSNLSTIAMISRSVQRAPELNTATKDKLAEIFDTAISTSEGMKDIVWFIKPTNETLDDLLLRMKDTASTLLANVEHDFDTSGNDPSKGNERVTIDFKRNFFLAFKEILTNIVKHASATRVEIRVDQKDGTLETTVRDNGKGFDPALQATMRRGNGLGSLRNRAKNIGGVCEITSHPAGGTTVRFSGRL
jgi:hypothetical protein